MEAALHVPSPLVGSGTFLSQTLSLQCRGQGALFMQPLLFAEARPAPAHLCPGGSSEQIRVPRPPETRTLGKAQLGVPGDGSP